MRLALIGLGAMGLPIARRLAAAGDHDLRLYDVQADRLAEAGVGTPTASVSEAIRGTDAIFTVLPADRHVAAVVGEIAEAAEPGQVLADLSTIAPSTIEDAARALRPAGVRVLSVAITRGTAAAERGELGLFVGGDEALVEQLRPALASIASEIRATGPLGSAKVVKIANNMIVSCIDIVICEAIVLGRSLGLEPAELVAHLAESGADGWALRNHIQKHVLLDDLGPGHFSTLNMAKDVALFLAMACRAGMPAPLAGTAAACYRGTIAQGHGLDYHPIVIRWLERISVGARELELPHDETLETVAGGVVAAQTLVSLEALRAIRAAGLSADEAVEHLGSGSARNESLATAAEPGTGSARALQAPLRRLLELANAASVPSFMFETAHHAALSLG